MSGSLARYLLRRLASLAVILLLVAVVVFTAIRLVPGDPARLFAGVDAREEDVALVRRTMGLDRPPVIQFATFLGRLGQGDLGRSLRSHRPVSQDLMRRLPASFWLASTSLVLAIAVGLPLGVVASTHRGRTLDFSAMGLSVLGVCMPTFWLGLLLITLFSACLLYTSPSPRDLSTSRMPSSA